MKQGGREILPMLSFPIIHVSLPPYQIVLRETIGSCPLVVK